MSEKFLPDEWDRAYAAGLDAAREAVLAALPHEDHCKSVITTRTCNCSRFDALAAIDALKEKP